MIITLIFLALFIVVGAVYYIFGESIDKSQMARNLDLSIDGLFKALGIVTVCIGLISMFPSQKLVGISNAEAMAGDQVENLATEKKTNEKETNEKETIENKIKADEFNNTEGDVKETLDLTTYQDGIYQGEGKGFKGYITMEVEVEHGQITRVEVVDHRDDRKWFNRANKVVPQSIIDSQSADVDTVSGATYTSLGMINGAEEALNKSRGE